jgi:hypothetical protein
MKYDIASASALMARTPSVLRSLLDGLAGEWLDAHEHAEAWSPRDVACHMADLEQDAWLPRIRAVLEHGNSRPLPAVDRERFRVRYADAPLGIVLDEFQSAREANLLALDALALNDEALQAAGRHGVLGDVRLSHLLSTWAVHDLTHLGQIVRALASQYRQEVGPWIDFLSILRAR